MKYLTKEWYWRMQMPPFFNLKIDPRAVQFSEALYQELLDQAKRAWLDDWQNLEAWMIERNHEAADFEDDPVLFKPESQRLQFFMSGKTEYQQLLERTLSAELKAKIADMRVLALDYAAPDVAEELMCFSRNARLDVQKTWNECREQQERSFAGKLPVWVKQFDFHDDHVTGLLMDGKDLIVSLIRQKPRKMIFRNAAIKKQDAFLVGAIWLYVEIYSVDGGYEIHVLLLSPKSGPVELTLRCDHVQFA